MALLELEEIRGRLPETAKRTILALARILDPEDRARGLALKEVVSQLAQLTALAGTGTPADAKILSMLIQGEMEDLGLTQQ